MVLGRGKRSAAFLAAAAMAVVSAGGRAAAQQAPIDPPARVGRISRIAGTVSFHLAGADQWEPASINLPVTTGSAFWAEPGARADLEIEGDHLVMGQATELDTTLLDDNTTALALPQGEVVLLEPASAVPGAVSVQTPRAAVTFRGAGRYEVIAGDTAAPTRVTVIEGAADVTGPGVTLHVGPGQTATLSGDSAVPPLQASLGPAVHDALLDGVLAEQRHPLPHPGCAPARDRAVDDRGRRTGGVWRLGHRARRRPDLVSAGRLRFCAVSRWPLGLRRALGLDVGCRGAMGIRAVALRPLGRDPRPLGLAAGTRGLSRAAGLRSGAGGLPGGCRVGCGDGAFGRLGAVGPARALYPRLSRQQRLLARGEPPRGAECGGGDRGP